VEPRLLKKLSDQVMNNTIDRDNLSYAFKAQNGLNRERVQQLWSMKKEPEWMLDLRLKSLEHFERMPMPEWGADLSELDAQNLCYYARPTDKVHTSWDKVPEAIKQRFERLGIPQAERRYLAGVGAQFESELIYKNLHKKWVDQGVIFSDISNAMHEYPELVKKYFGTVIRASDNKFSALNGAVWSGGSFVYVPHGVHIDMPLQAYFRINDEQVGQFERTLIIAEPGSFVHYVEGCSAPKYQSNSLHSAVVEVVALPGSHVRYTTIQNWSNSVYNLVTKRAIAYKNARVEWIDGNFGSKVTMKYPSVVLKESGASGHVMSIAVAGDTQWIDSGAKMIHCASNTSSSIVSKSISQSGGRSSYRGLVKILPGVQNVSASVVCDALLMDQDSRSDTYPTIDVKASENAVVHEASVSKISDAQKFYIQTRAISEQAASAMIVNGFIDPFVQHLPLEYAVEINRLIEMEMEGSVG
jgi:Fe-S cluster assembly protein SufB